MNFLFDQQKNMNILIRCDSSNIIGTGHIMRMLNLCDYYPNHKFTFLCRNFNMNISQKIIDKYHALISLDYNIEPILNDYRTWIGKKYEDEINEFRATVEENKYDIILIDHYGIDYLLEQEIKKYCNKIIIITDIFDFNHYCDIFINYSCDDLDKIKTINLNKNTVYKIGAKNIILNKKFNDSKKKTFFNIEIKNLIINMGGSDPPNFTLKILNIINDYIIKNNIFVKIIIGKSNNHIKSIEEFINDIKNYKIYFDINYDNMIDLYLNCDLAIGTLSVTAYERLILNIPQICLKIVDNQLIQQLDKFNIVTIDKLLDKIIDYNKIIKD